MEFDLKDIQAQAQKEFENELFREAVEQHKQKLRTKRTIMDRLFPWKIIIIRKGSK